MKISPVVAITICWIVGNVTVGLLHKFELIGALLLMIMGLLLLYTLRKIEVKLMIVLLLCFVISGMQRYWVDANNVSQLQHYYDSSEGQSYEVALQGIITSSVQIDGNKVSFDVQNLQLTLVLNETYEKKEKYKVQLTLEQQSEVLEAEKLARGQQIQLVGELVRPNEHTNEGGFNYRQYLYFKKIHWLVKVKGISNIEQEQSDTSFTWYKALKAVDVGRVKLASPFDSLYEKSESGYLKGLILGIREDIDPEQFRQFSTIGLTHILAISGLHVAVFMYMITAILKLFRFSKEKIIYILLLLIPMYVLLTGASPSVLRAGMMAMMALVAARMNLLKNGLSLISLTALTLIIIDPYMIHNISFQLSFIVTLGLIVGVTPFSRWLGKNVRWKWLNDTIAVSLVAQLFSFPLSIFYFNQIHLLSLLANLLLIPFISSIIMPLGTLSLFVAHLDVSFAKPIASIVHWLNEGSFTVVRILSEVSALHMIWPTPRLWWIGAWYSLLLWFIHMLKRQWTKNMNTVSSSSLQTKPIHEIPEYEVVFPSVRNNQHKYKTLIIFSLLICFVLVYGYNPNLLSRTAIISFIDIGQGDATFITSPTGKHILIDGGGTLSFQKADEEWKIRQDPFEIGKDVLVPLLMKRGIHQIDLLVISHLDGDHIGGLIEVVKTIPIKEVWWNGSYKEDAKVDELFLLLIDKNVKMTTPVMGDHIEIDRHTTIDMLWPLEQLPSTISYEDSQNEHSLVFLLQVYNQNILFTGDIGEKSERKIVDQLLDKHTERVNVDIMKIAHHGSRYSTGYTWLSYFRPQLSVISVGAYNFYGHPHPNVLSRLDQYHSVVQRTDQLGEAKFVITKDDMYLKKWK